MIRAYSGKIMSTNASPNISSLGNPPPLVAM